MDGGRGSDLVCLDLCKVFDNVPPAILVCMSERHGLDGWSPVWMKLIRCSGFSQPSGAFIFAMLAKGWQCVCQGVAARSCLGRCHWEELAGLFGAGFVVGVEWRRLCPGSQSGCSASETRGSGEYLFVTGLYFLWHKEVHR